MLVLGNSYQLRDLKNNIFDEYFNAKNTTSHFATLNDYHVYSVKNELYALKSGKSKIITSFKADITFIAAQKDMACVGTLNGEIHIFSEHRASIRRFHKHTAEITDILITDSNIVISSGKDSKINLYSLLDDKIIECIDLDNQIPKKIIVSGDELFVFTKDILIYTLNNNAFSRKIDMNISIENAVMLSDDTILAISKNKGYVVDLKTSKILKTAVMHTREITSISIYENRIYTSSLDGHFKSFNMNLVVINDFNFHKKLISFSIHNNRPFVVCESGEIFTVKSEKTVEKQRSSLKKAPAYEDEIEYENIETTKRRLTDIEMLFRNYEYKKAFMRCFNSNDLKTTFGILKYLSKKRVFMRVLKDSDEDFLKNTLQLCLEIIKIEEFTPIITEILIIITSVYFEDLSENPMFLELLNEISRQLDEILLFEEVFLKAVSFAESFVKE